MGSVPTNAIIYIELMLGRHMQHGIRILPNNSTPDYSNGNRTPDLLFSNPTPYLLSHLLPHVGCIPGRALIITVAHSCHSLYYFSGRQYFCGIKSFPRNICGTQSIPPVYEVAGVASCTFISAQIAKRRESRHAFGLGVFSTVSPWASGGRFTNISWALWQWCPCI